MADTFNTFKAAYGGTTTVTTFPQAEQALIITCSDETTALTAASPIVTFRMPYAFKADKVKASVNTAPTGSAITVAAVTGSTTIGTVTIAATEKTGNATVSQAIADDAEIKINLTAIGSTVAGTGLKFTIIGRKQDD